MKAHGSKPIAAATALRLATTPKYHRFMSDDYGIDYGHYSSGGCGSSGPPNDRALKVGWTFALICGFAGAMLGDRLLGGGLFLMIGGLFTWADYVDKRRWENQRDYYESQHGPHPSRLANLPMHAYTTAARDAEQRRALAAWLKTPLGKQWLETPQAREFLATTRGQQFRKDYPPEGR